MYLLKNTMNSTNVAALRTYSQSTKHFSLVIHVYRVGSAYGSLSFPDPCNLNYPDVESAWVLHQVELSLTVQPVVCLATHSYVLP